MGRRTLDQLIKKIFKNYSLKPRLLTKIFSISLKLNSHRYDDFIEEMFSIIYDIWKPLTSAAPTKYQLLDKDFKVSNLLLFTTIYSFLNKIPYFRQVQNNLSLLYKTP